MKILFVTNYPSPYRVHFFNELGKYCDLTVLFEENIENQTHKSKKWFYNKYENFEYIFMKQTFFLNKFICLEIKKYLNDEFDLIIITNYSTLTGINAINYMKKNNIKFAIEADGGFHKDGRGFKEKLKKKLISSASWWFSTGDLTDYYFEFYGANKERIYRYPFTSLLKKDLIENSTSKENKLKIRKELGIKEKKIILGVGRFIPIKGFDILMDACEGLDNDVGVYIVGGEPPAEYIKKKDELEFKNIYFVDFQVKEELKKFYKASDLFVLPTRGDIWGLVINEAMSYGLPIITTDKCVAGLELIENGDNGYIVPVNNIKKLSTKMKHIINDYNLMKKMQLNNIQKIKNYTIENMAKTHIEIFEKIIKLN